MTVTFHISEDITDRHLFRMQLVMEEMEGVAFQVLPLQEVLSWDW